MRSKLVLAMLVASAAAGCGDPGDTAATPASEASARPEKGANAATTPSEVALQAWIRKESRSPGDLGYRSSEHDLDGDGQPEVLAYVAGEEWCSSGGCSLVVLKHNGTNVTEVVRTTNTGLPLGVLDSASRGWRDLWVSTADSDELSGRRILKFDGTSYPSDPAGLGTEPLEILDTQILIEEGDLIRLN
jgi:hypothetical protein